MITRRTIFAICIILHFLFFSCSKQTKTESDTFSSPRTLFVEYVSSYTSGFITKKSEITVKLAKPVNSAESGKEIDSKIFSFEPNIQGKAYWEDKRTVIFKPTTDLKSGQKYKTSFLLNKLVEVPKEKEEFKFTFVCIPQNYDVKIEGITLYNISDLSKVKLTGIIQTADHITNEQAEKIITASQNNNSLEINYEHSSGLNTHRFSIENINRADAKGKVKIEWNGDEIGVDRSEEIVYEIPSLQDFTVTSVQTIRLGDQNISVKFSDPINERQNLRGLVKLSEGIAPRVVVNLNELKVYISGKLSGEMKLIVDKSIENTAGYTLKEDYQCEINFSQLKPDVKITANNGVVMPSSEGLIVPFKAVNLNAVDLTIIRIFEDNILQYLQVNDLGNDYQIHRVGRPLVRKTIPLAMMGATNLNEWNRYSIDIAEHIKVEPGIFYQIRLSFRKSQSLYFCSDSENKAIELLDNLDYEEETYWGEYEQYQYYDWRERDNPCHEAYYASRRGSRKIVFASDIGLLAKKADKGNLLVFTTNLISTVPINGVQIEVFDYQQQLISSGLTNDEGKLELPIDQKPYTIIAKKEQQFGYLKLDDGSSLSLSNFNVSGSKIQKGLKGFIYGERGVWRPSDTLHLSFMLDDIQNRLPEHHPVILELYNPMNQLFNRQIQSNTLNGIYIFDPATPKDAPTGNWTAKVKVGGASFSKRIKIETVKPNRLKINLKFDDDKLYASGGYQHGKLEVRWLHGAIAKNLRARYELLLVPTKTTFRNYENVTFDDPSKEFISESKQIFEGRLDEKGFAIMPFKLETGSEPPGMLKAIFKGKVFEEGGDFSIDNTPISYVPYQSFAGVKAPEGDKRGMLVTDKSHKVRIVSLDATGNPIDRSLEVSLYKLQWRWWWDNSWESISNYSSSYYSKLVKTDNVKTKDGEGIYNLRIDNQEWGRYLLKVKDPVSGHSTGKIIYIDWPGWAGKQKGELGGATMLDFDVEQTSVKVGEFIRINIPSSKGGRALISLETGSKVLQTFWVETKPENTTVEFEATSAMSPNIYVNITMLQPHSQTSNDLPIRMYGVQAIEVADPETQLTPVIAMQNELRSEQEFKITVSEKHEKPMTYTIAIVEDGLLDLTKFRTPKPWDSFYAREALGVKTWDIFDNVMGSYGGELEKLMAIGGDDEIEAPDAKEANRFKPVVMFKGPFFARAGERIEHKFKLPQYIGSVRVMVVAGYEGAFGESEKTVPVKQPLMILATLPRVAGPTEEITLPVNVFAMDDKIHKVEIKVSTEGKLGLVEKKSKTIVFDQQGDQVVYFNLKASQALGLGKVHVEASSGSFKASYDVELQIRASNPEISQVKELVLEGGKTWDVSYNPLGLISTNEGMIEISSLPPLNLEQRLNFLIKYPHGCIEQTTSAVFAQLYLDDLMEINVERAAQIQENINAAIERLRSFQLSDGGFSYWPGSSQPNLWGTNYAGHFLIEARNQGYHVPEDMISNWVAFQQEKANNWNAILYKDSHVQAYRLYTLALKGEPSLGAMNRLKDIGKVSAKWSLASAYAVAGYKDAALEIINGLTTATTAYNELGGTFGSAQRDQAMMLETMVSLDKKTDAFAMIKKISVMMGDNKRWMSTQTTAFCLMGIAEFAKHFPTQGGANVSVSISGNEFRVDGDRYLNQVTLLEPDQASTIKIVNNGNNPLFVKLIKSGVPLEGMEKAGESNLKMGLKYKNMQGEIISVENLKQGTDFIAEVTVTNPGFRGDYEELAITQIFPSGWEILNNRLDDTDQAFIGDRPEYLDIRDDRVLTYFDLKKNKKATFKVYLNASYQGTYYMPAVFVEAMYDNKISANTKGQWINVVK